MAKPFSNLFGKLKDRLRPAAPAAPVAPVRAEKPSSEKLAKTVMPNATRTVSPPDPFQVAAGAGARSTIAPTGLPPAVAVALKPRVERTVSLQLSDFLSQIPANYLKPADTIDEKRPILLKASEVEKGMAIGKPAVSLTAIYEQIPEIFERSVPPNEMMQVPLPFEKVLEQFSNARVRDDQERNQILPQVDTPILQATIEDNEKFGTSIAPIEISAEPQMRVQPASAKSLSDAEPETVRDTPAPPPTRSTIRLTIPLEPVAKAPTSTTPNEPPPPAPASSELPPNGTDALAPERVPASSGPSVPIRLPKPSGPPTKVKPPCADLKPKLTLVPGVANMPPQIQAVEDYVPPPKSKTQSSEPKISLPLRPILEMIPPFQLNGTPDMVPEEARIEFPLSLVQSQLAIGRVVVSPKKFQSALPRRYRDLLVIDTAETPVQLPLHEVLKNIPRDALKMRDDQEEAERGPDFETPFSQKAREDEEKFRASEVQAEEPAPVQPNESKIDIDKIDKVEAPALDAKQVIAQASVLDGVAGCVVTMADGLSLAGDLPEEMAVGGLCAVAPSMLQRIQQHMFQTNLGPLNAMTLHGDKSAITFFSRGNVYLTVLHGHTQLSDETYEKLSSLTNELARTYAPLGEN